MANNIKMKTIKRLIFVLFMLSTLASQAQKPNLDSLFRVWNDKTALDTNRLKAIHKIAREGYLNFKPDSAFYYAQLHYDFAKTKGLKKQMADALIIQGYSYQIRSDYPKALDYFQRSLKIYEEISDKKAIANSLVNIGQIYISQDEYSIAMDYFQRSLAKYEEISDKKGVVTTLTNIGYIYDNQGYISKALSYFRRGIKVYEEISDEEGIAGVLGDIGYIYMRDGNYSKALEYFHRSLKLYEESNSKYFMSSILIGIGSVYMDQENYLKALEYFQQSLKIKEELDDKHGIGRVLILIGCALVEGDYSKALDTFQKGLKICEEISDKNGIAQILDYTGHVYYYQGDYPKSLDYIKRSLKVYEEIPDNDGILKCLEEIGVLYEEHGNPRESTRYYEKALLLAEEIGTIYYQQSACEYLYDAYKSMGNDNKALEYLEKMLMLTDSLNKEKLTEKLQKMEFAKKAIADSLIQVAKEQEVQHTHEIEVRKKNRTKNFAFGIGLLVLIVAIALFSRLRYTRKAKVIIEKEKDRSDNLLLNILPAEIAAELKEKGEAAARDFDTVSVLFTDFVEFTQISEKLSATELVAEINYCFKGFDGICEKYGIEKIKTIGDAYMAAGGLPVTKDDSTKNTVLAALEMADFIVRRKIERETSRQIPFEMRLGIHTGAVVAGIVGVKKFQYDIWGDTVNTASRMESSGEVGKVNISQSTYELIKNDAVFTFESRGKIETKGKGEIEMWFVERVV
jgi:adenylate cyclase